MGAKIVKRVFHDDYIVRPRPMIPDEDLVDAFTLLEIGLRKVAHKLDDFGVYDRGDHFELFVNKRIGGFRTQIHRENMEAVTEFVLKTLDKC